MTKYSSQPHSWGSKLHQKRFTSAKQITASLAPGHTFTNPFRGTCLAWELPYFSSDCLLRFQYLFCSQPNWEALCPRVRAAPYPDPHLRSVADVQLAKYTKLGGPTHNPSQLGSVCLAPLPVCSGLPPRGHLHAVPFLSSFLLGASASHTLPPRSYSHTDAYTFKIIVLPL